MTSDSLAALMDRNRRFAEQFEAGDLVIRPRLAMIILTCVDSRVDPTHLFGLELGDALVIRNTGGRVNRGVLGDLGVLGVVALDAPGRGSGQQELIIIQHTDCGMSRLADPTIQQQVAERLGLSVDEAAALAITDPAKSVQDDIEQLRQTPGIPDQLIVSGFVYDVKNGTLNQVVPPAQLRATP